MKEEVIVLDNRYGEKYAGRYVFSEISWAKRSRILDRNTKYNRLSGLPEQVDRIAIQAELVMASLKEQPEHKPITLEKLLDEENGVPIALGELFSQTANRLNSLSLEETRFLSDKSAEENLTLPSPSTGSAPSSSVSPASLEGNRQKQSKSSL